MSPTVRTPDRPATEAWMWALFASLAAIWGSSFGFRALDHLPTGWVGWVAIVWLGVFGTGVACLLFFGILERWGATRTPVTYMLPLIALTLGFVLLEERLRAIELVGAVHVIGGVVLVNGTLGGRRAGRERRFGLGPDTEAEARA